ncbi:MAG TPA: tRNA 2-methylthio-N6-isopentenyl adenosine(37) hydroxylase MiaE [Cytophagales bacterium]|jgi:tRNA-(ms[2]io[6]A)-hydroxylase|nr:tRNA 2-methylthio-N6-isopentenyl adenosine(37) hydroxylase MiaE [Cytophagales bacterium]
MLGLKLPTDPRWINLAEKSTEEILVDHAYCEQKAASSCISMIVTFSEYPKVVEVLTPVVAEEWGHFRMVLKELKKRGYVLGRPRTDEYVKALMQVKQKGGSKEQRLMEECLVNALIEARSCERFRVLSEGLEDPHLKTFYRDLMISEATHYVNFIDLAKTYWPEDKVKQRWQEYLNAEAGIMKRLELRGDRMH